MDEKEIIRIGIHSIKNHLNAALEECEKVEKLKELFYEKINNLLGDFTKEVLKLHMGNMDLI